MRPTSCLLSNSLTTRRASSGEFTAMPSAPESLKPVTKVEPPTAKTFNSGNVLMPLSFNVKQRVQRCLRPSGRDGAPPAAPVF